MLLIVSEPFYVLLIVGEPSYTLLMEEDPPSVLLMIGELLYVLKPMRVSSYVSLDNMKLYCVPAART